MRPDNRSESGNDYRPGQQVYSGTLDDAAEPVAGQGDYEWSARAESWGVDAVDDDPWSAEFILTLVTDQGDRVNCVLPLNNPDVTSEVQDAIGTIARAQGLEFGTSTEEQTSQGGWLGEARQQDPYASKFEKAMDPLRIRQLSQSRGGLAIVGTAMMATFLLALLFGLIG